MPRPWTTYTDPDSSRLPEGITRVGYDADTQRYSYRDERGKMWVGGEGNRYGVLNRTRGESPGPDLPSYKATARDKAQAVYDAAQRKAEKKEKKVAQKTVKNEEKPPSLNQVGEKRKKSIRRMIRDEEKSIALEDDETQEKDKDEYGHLTRQKVSKKKVISRETDPVWRKDIDEYGRLSWRRATSEEEAIDKDMRSSWHYLAPFISLCVTVVLWMLWLTAGSDDNRSVKIHCKDGSVQYPVKIGDSCWDIAQMHGIDVIKLETINKERWNGDTGLSCEALNAGDIVCIPVL